MSSRERLLPFEGAVNFRDLGGYPAGPGRRTRYGRLYRSDNLGALTAADVGLLDRLGLRTIVDFRVDEERGLHADRLPPGHDITTLLAPFLPAVGTTMLRRVLAGELTAADAEAAMATQYRAYVTDHAREFRTPFEPLLDSNRLPVLVHCTSGKDRTGFAIALVLSAVGVPLETIFDDYLLTNAYRRDVRHLFGPATAADVIETVTGARESFLAAALDEIERTFGSMDAYLQRGLGLSDDARARLHENLTETDDAAGA